MATDRAVRDGPASGRPGRRGPVIRDAILVGWLFVMACGQPDPDPPSSVSDAVSFEGAVQCQLGEEDGAANWDYGANPRGTIDDPVAWVREETIGLDPTLSLSFIEEFRGQTDSLDNVVLATDEHDSVVAFVEFGLDDEGRYYPLYAETCASAGIEEFG
jgi:hypothetical protein